MHTHPFYTTRTFYIVMTATFVLALAILFTTTTRDLRAVIEDAFVAETSAVQELTVENEHYLALKQKLKLPDVAPREVAGALPVASTTPTEVATTSTPALVVSDYTLAVRNGTSVNGLAGKLADILLTAGFAKAVTGNATPQGVTEIYIQEDIRAEVFALLRTAAPELLEGAQLMANNPTSADIVIILGGK